MDFEKVAKLIDQWKGLLTGIGLLLAAIIGVHKALNDVDLRTWSWPEISVAAVSIVLLAIVTFRSRTIHVSRLVDPDALKLDPQSPEQLVGRREDLDKLLKALANPLVFLVSESGCGKSALLRAGVAQGPVFTSRFLPIYIDLSVLDWEAGRCGRYERGSLRPCRMMTQRAASSMPAPLRGSMRKPLTIIIGAPNGGRCFYSTNSTTTRRSRITAGAFYRRIPASGGLPTR
jgi:hypothetical protein